MSISTGVMKQYETENYIVYQLGCDCGDPECNVLVTIEMDKEYPFVGMTYYKTFHFWYSTNYTDEILEKIKNFCKSIVWRIKSAFKILFIGHIEIKSDICFQNEEHICDLIQALNEGHQHLKNQFSKLHSHQSEEKMKNNKTKKKTTLDLLTEGYD